MSTLERNTPTLKVVKHQLVQVMPFERSCGLDAAVPGCGAEGYDLLRIRTNN